MYKKHGKTLRKCTLPSQFRLQTSNQHKLICRMQNDSNDNKNKHNLLTQLNEKNEKIETKTNETTRHRKRKTNTWRNEHIPSSSKQKICLAEKSSSRDQICNKLFACNTKFTKYLQNTLKNKQIF